jgi:hypothetical protein
MLVKHLLFASFRFQRRKVKNGVAKMQQSLSGLGGVATLLPDGQECAEQLRGRF